MTLAFSPAEAFGRVPDRVLVPELMRLVVRPCACGGAITADAGHPAPSVLQHNRTWPHVRWWARVRDEWQGEDA